MLKNVRLIWLCHDIFFKNYKYILSYYSFVCNENSLLLWVVCTGDERVSYFQKFKISIKLTDTLPTRSFSDTNIPGRLSLSTNVWNEYNPVDSFTKPSKLPCLLQVFMFPLLRWTIPHLTFRRPQYHYFSMLPVPLTNNYMSIYYI